MAKLINLLILIIFFSITTSYTQILYENIGHIPQQYQIEWAKSGLLPNTQKYAEHFFNITDYGAIPDDNIDDYSALMNALNEAKNAEGLAIVYLPQGTFDIRSTINLDKYYSNIVIQGAGAGKTFLKILVGHNSKGFNIYGSESSNEIILNESINKGDKELYVSDANSLSEGIWIHYFDLDYPVEDSSKYRTSVGQISRIETKSGNLITLLEPASKYYSIDYGPYLSKITPIMNFGLENFTIIRNEGTKSGENYDGSNISLTYAVNCWIKGIESKNTPKEHIKINFSAHIEVSGCYIHDSEDYGDGGYGYGINLQRSSNFNLIENNIFNNLRHSIVIQAGANSNVVIYNYSTNNHGEWSGFSYEIPDITLHGRYPFANLIEHNFAVLIAADESHGLNGPYNTFFRNINKHEDDGSNNYMVLSDCPYSALEGLEIEPNGFVPSENNGGIYWYGTTSLTQNLYGYYEGNNNAQTHRDVYLSDNRTECYNEDVSYYYSQIPQFLEGNFSFPSIGPKQYPYGNLTSQNIPARARFKSTNQENTYNEDSTVPPLDVMVDQKDSNLSTFGYVFHWEKVDTTYSWQDQPAPHTYEFRLYSDQVIKSEQGLHNGEKFNNWNNNEYLLNHNSFTIKPELTNLIAYFNKVYNISVKSELGNYGSYNTVKLMDPWYRDFDEQPYGVRNQGMSAPFIEIPYPYQITTNSDRQGVFLDQGYDPVNNTWTPPYYKVKAEAQQTFTAHGKDITGYFLGWEGTDVVFEHPDQQETAVVFQADGAEARAVYKGHLASSVARATGYNNGRRIAKDGSGMLHLVYEDDNQIWYTYSTDNGYHWSKEEKICDFAGNPSIAITNGQPGEDVHVHVVWETPAIDQNGQEIHYISYSKRSTSGWSNPIVLSEGEYSPLGYWTGPDCRRPTIIGEGSDYLFVAWKSGNKIKIINHSNGIWSNVTTVPGAYDGYPVIGRTYSGTRKTKVIWSDDGDIRYIEGGYLGNNSWSWSGIKSLTSNFSSVIYSNYNPTMDIAPDGKGYVSWEAVSVSSGERGVYFCKYDMYNNASQAWYLTLIDQDYGNHLYPSINWDSQQNKCILVYQKANHIYYKTNNYNSSTWTSADYGPGYYPNLPLEDFPVPIWTTYNSAPYLLKDYILYSYLAKNAITKAREYKRFIFPTDIDSTYLIANLKNFSYNNNDLSFGQKLRSEPIKIKGEGIFKYRIELDSLNIKVNHERLRFWFVSGDEKYLLDQVELSGEEKENLLDRSVTFDAGKTKEGYVQIDFPDSQPFVINVVPEDNSGSGLAKVAVAPEANPFVPKTFRLNQNFPNPFNPTTQITFDLPVDAKIRLQVFDLSGHQVATLAQGFRSAGRYSVVFDGRNLASGIYIYRLTTDKGFSQSKKMMLIK